MFGTGIDYDIFGDTRSVRWKRETREVIKEEHGDYAPFAYSAARNEALVINLEGKLKVVPDSGNDPVAMPEFSLPSGRAPQAAALSDDGRWIAVSDNKNILLLDRSAPSAAPRVLERHQGTVMALEFSRGSRFLASAGADRTARLWSLDADARGACEEMAGGHTGTIYAIAFNHRGDQLVTASADGTLRVWDARYGAASCGREIVALEWHSDAVNDVRFHPTDNVIFTASDDGSVKGGMCRACDLTVADMREQVLKTNLAVLTQSDRDEIEHLRKVARGSTARSVP